MFIKGILKYFYDDIFVCIGTSFIVLMAIVKLETERYYQKVELLGFILLAFILLNLLIYRKRKLIILKIVLICILSFFIFFLTQGNMQLSQKKSNDFWKEYDQQEINFVGIIADEPEYTIDSVRLKVKFCGFDGNFICKNDKNNTSSVIYLETNRYPIKNLGDICLLKGEISEIQNFSTGFDYKKYMNRKGLFWKLEKPHIICEDSVNFKQDPFLYIRSSMSKFREGIASKIERKFLEPYASLLIGIIFGSDRVFDEKFSESLKNSGTMHIIAASGYNVNFVKNIADKIIFFMPKKIRLFLSIIMIILFIFISGGSASVLRASIMAILIIIYKLVGRPYKIERVLFMTVFFICFLKPTILFDIGFQLSAIATAGIIFISPIIIKLIEKRKGLFKKLLSEDILVSICTLLSTAPVFLINFNSLSLVGIISNLFISPIIDLLIIGGLIFIFLDKIKIFYFFADLIGIILGGFLKYLVLVIEFFGNQKIGIISLGNSKEDLGLYSGLLCMFFIILFFIKKIGVYRKILNEEKRKKFRYATKLYDYYIK